MKRRAPLKNVIRVLIVLLVLWALGAAVSLIQLGKRISKDDAFTRELVADAGGVTQLLAACRNLLEDQKGDRDISSVPQIILSLKPREITVYQDRVHIVIDVSGRRAALIGFATDAQEYGTSMLTNGIWYWNGHPSESTLPAYQKMLDRKRQGEKGVPVSLSP